MNKNYYYTTYGFYLLFFFVSFLAQAQKAPDIQWSKTYGGSRADYFSQVRALPNGGYIAVGTTASNNGDIDPKKTTTDNDWWIVELDNEGNMVRQAVYGTTGSDLLFNVIPMEDSGYIVIGSVASVANGDFLDVLHQGGTSNNAVIAKLNDTLGIEWIKNFGGSGSQQLPTLKKALDGGYIACGSTTSQDGDVKGKQNGTTNDWWIVKFDAQFNIQYEKTFGGSGPGTLLNEAATSVIPLKNGGYAVVA